jgi:iron complex outermembrane receptor protein
MLLRHPPFLFAALTLSSLVHAEDLQLAPVEVTGE